MEDGRLLSLNECKRLLDIAVQFKLYDVDSNEENDPEREGNIIVVVNNDDKLPSGEYSVEPSLAAEILANDYEGQQSILKSLEILNIHFVADK